MVLNFEYGINTGNRFLDFVDHDEDPDEFIARQTQPEEKSKKPTKDSKTASSATSKKPTNKATPTSTANVTSTTTKANKENVSGKSTNDQRRPQSSVSGDNNQQYHHQQQRTDSGRGSGRGFSRRGASSAGQERPAYEGSGRGGGQQRSQRFNRFEGQPGSRDARNFEQSGEVGEAGSHPQRFGGYQGRGRGGGGDRGRGAPRGTFYNRNYEGGRGRGRGRGGRGNFNNRNTEEGSQEQQQQQQQQPQQEQPRTQEDNEWHPNTDSSFDNTRSQPVKTENEDLNADSSLQERSFEPDGLRRGGRGHFRARTFRSNRSYGQEHQYQHDRAGGEGGQEEYRHNRRQHDRQPRSYTSTVKPTEKKDGEGAHNWGNATEIPDEQLPVDEPDETTDQGASTGKGWAEQVDEAEKKQMTLDEYKKQLEEKKRANQEKLPQLHRRAAGEGEDQKNWQFKHEYRKKNDNDESGEEEEEQEASDVEAEDEDDEGEQNSGKKKLITIPLRFNPIELPRGGPFGARGGQRRGGGGRFQDRPYRDDQQRSKSPNQQQSPVSPQTGEYHRGGPRQGSGRGEYRRSYGNSARGSRGGYNRSNANPNTLDLNDTRDFPTLLKQ